MWMREASHVETDHVWTGDVNTHSRFGSCGILVCNNIDDDSRSCNAILALCGQ
jgi:hypothetical protein